MPFDAKQFPSSVARLLAVAPTCPLGPGSPGREQRSELAGFRQANWGFPGLSLIRRWPKGRFGRLMVAVLLS